MTSPETTRVLPKVNLGCLSCFVSRPSQLLVRFKQQAVVAGWTSDEIEQFEQQFHQQTHTSAQLIQFVGQYL